MAARILMVVAVLMALYGCGQSPETADSFEGVEQPSSPDASASGTVMPTGHDAERESDVVEQARLDGRRPAYVYIECGYGAPGVSCYSTSATASASVSPFPVPPSGGPAILLPAAALLLGSGILTYAILRRR